MTTAHDRLLKSEVVSRAPNSADDFRQMLLSLAFRGVVPAEDLHLRIASFAAASAPNSLRALVSDLRILDAFQRDRQQPAFPLTPSGLYMLIVAEARRGKAKASISRLVASVVRMHQLMGLPDPLDDNVRWKLREVRKADSRQIEQARGLRLKGEVADVHEDDPQPLSLLELLTWLPSDPAGLRDKALLSVGYDAGMRRSELVRVQVRHVERLPNGEASLFIPRSKTDQEGEGARAWLSRRSVDHLDCWLTASQIKEGFVFRPLSYRVSSVGHLSEGAVSKILKQRLKAFLGNLVLVGELQAEEAERAIDATSSHSLRVGCDQDLFAAGVDIGAIMQGLRWSSPKQPLAYARHLGPASSKLAAVMRQIR